MVTIYHIVARGDWERGAEQPYRHPSLASAGFIHCSRSDQVAWVANLFYADQQDLVVLAINPGQLTSPLKYETIETGASFPHVYGPIDRAAVIEVLPLQRGADGKWAFP